jgi:drug/metabolite transporter (DMT)-like permease
MGGPVLIWAGALIAVMLWGASPVATKIAVTTIPAAEVAVWRTVIGGLLALPVALLMRLPLPKTPGQRGLLALSAGMGFIVFPLIFSIGQGRTSATHGALILALLSVFTGAYAMAWDRKRPAARWYLGCVIALAGEAVLILSKDGGGEATLLGDLIMLLSTLTASLGYVAGGRLARSGYPAVATTFWGVVIAVPLVAPFAIVFALNRDMGAVATDAWIAVLYLAVAVTILGYVLWYWALGKGGIARIGLAQFFQPISGVLLAAVLLSEPLTLPVGIAAALVIAGVFIASRAR